MYIKIKIHEYTYKKDYADKYLRTDKVSEYGKQTRTNEDRDRIREFGIWFRFFS